MACIRLFFAEETASVTCGAGIRWMALHSFAGGVSPLRRTVRQRWISGPGVKKPTSGIALFAAKLPSWRSALPDVADAGRMRATRAKYVADAAPRGSHRLASASMYEQYGAPSLF